jgi:hypothetical protein
MAITNENGTTVITGAEDIAFFRLVALRSALRLELVGLRVNRNVNAYAIAKREFGFKGSKQKVYDQLCAYVEQVRQARALAADPDTAQA